MLTIITVTKDDPAGLELTLQSTAAWRKLDWVEQIVVHAGSVAPSIEPPDGIRLVAQVSRGIAGAFNEGLAAAQGEWVWFLNGGDRIDARLAPAHLRYLLASSSAEMIVGGLTYEGAAALHAPPPLTELWPALQSWIPHPSSLIRRQLFEKFGPFDERYQIAMDYEWWLRATGAGAKVDLISIPVAVFAGGGISQRPESLARIALEQTDAMRRHRRGLWKAWLAYSRRMLRAARRILFAGPIDQPGREI